MAKKDDLPAMPFYWGDWFKAPDVQMLPRDIRCTWFEMLGRMWENSPRGEISVNKKPLTDEQMATLLGFGSDVEMMKRHINYLERFSLFSRKKSGVIYSRKLVKMNELSCNRSKAGKLGMSVRYNKTDNKTLTNTENENENEKNIKKEGGVGGEKKNDVDFEEFWERYPNKADRSRAIKAYRKHVKTDKCKREIVTALANYKKHLSVNTWKRAKNGATFINNYNDWLQWDEPDPIASKPTISPVTTESARRLQERWDREDE